MGTVAPVLVAPGAVAVKKRLAGPAIDAHHRIIETTITPITELTATSRPARIRNSRREQSRRHAMRPRTAPDATTRPNLQSVAHARKRAPY